ncbi:MAG: hypothetical protein M1820_008689 [Bogoriella megaspora]|nr:MAG: hypothetical protein M1820_008689 [Bogoriella megaspora]
MNVKDSRGSGHYLPLLGHNEKWKRQRKFIHHKMSWSITLKHRDIPYQETFQMLADIIDRPDRYEEIMDDYTGRVISRVCYGRVESFREIKATSFALLGAISPSENLTNLIPFLSYIPYYLSPWKQTEQRRYEKERRLFFRLQEHVRYEGDKLEDSFMKQYLKSEKKEVPEEEAAYAIGMTALAGMLTTASIKINYILAACHYPSWQAAIQQEIDLICGDRMVKACDAPNLPTLRAVIKELIRWRPIIPASIPHQTEQDDWYDGRFIPAGTRIHPNSWALSHDPELYPDPEAFNPDRWLKPEYPTFKEPLTTYPTIRNMFIFGFGRRVCMGQDLVEAELIVAIGNLAWACNISQKLGLDGKPMPIPIDASAASYTAQLISRPKTFPFELVPRSENRAQQVRENLEAYKGI